MEILRYYTTFKRFHCVESLNMICVLFYMELKQVWTLNRRQSLMRNWFWNENWFFRTKGWRWKISRCNVQIYRRSEKSLEGQKKSMAINSKSLYVWACGTNFCKHIHYIYFCSYVFPYKWKSVFLSIRLNKRAIYNIIIFINLYNNFSKYHAFNGTFASIVCR